MNKWIKLIEERPIDQGIYYVIRLNWENKFKIDSLKWKDDWGFQPLEENEGKFSGGSYPINMNVLYWLKMEMPLLPEDLGSLIVEIETYFHKEGLDEYVKENGIKIYDNNINANDYIITGISESVLREMRKRFNSQNIRKVAIK